MLATNKHSRAEMQRGVGGVVFVSLKTVVYYPIIAYVTSVIHDKYKIVKRQGVISLFLLHLKQLER